MSYDLSSSMNKLTDLYLDKAGLSSKQVNSYSLGKGNRKDMIDSITNSLNREDELKGKFGKEFDEVYDSLQAMRALDQVMKQSYEMNHKDDNKNANVKDAHSAMTFSKGSSKLMDMLTTQVSSEMDEKVHKAMKDGLDSMTSSHESPSMPTSENTKTDPDSIDGSDTQDEVSPFSYSPHPPLRAPSP